MDNRPPEKKEEEAKEAERRAEENREALDEIPPPGTDPLHEGP
jgi:hypothetical protein